MQLGLVISTERIHDICDAFPGTFFIWMQSCLHRHYSEDWGDLDPEDKKLNDDAVKNGERVLSAYNIHAELREVLKEHTDEEKIWVITGEDRSVTTVLFPSEY